MTHHLVSGTAGEPRRSLPARKAPPREAAVPSVSDPDAPDTPPQHAWTRSDRGWSPTSWRQGTPSQPGAV